MFEETFKLKIVPENLPNGEAIKYVGAVRGVLARIYQSQCGKALLNSIRYHDHLVKVVPYTDSDACGADVESDFDPDTVMPRPRVRYTPGKFARTGSCSHLPGRGWPESILFHELVHALRLIARSKKKEYKGTVMTGGLHRYDDFEEFIAVLCQGIYVSERGGPHPLLGDHRGVTPLAKDLDDSFKFFASGSKTYRFVNRFCNDNPGFTGALARVATRFNPLRAFYQDRRKALRYSTSTAAHERDALGVEGQLFERERQPALPKAKS